ncbi:SDR family oxidoreductase [Fulvivirga sediminis]|uniref:SDR family oxidoreductase n=1 Tax=Fulvivirga sediminis TaxID=2803949 RepID=A0A937FAW8_9BACT|nr:SDR family oxidoreductase [Fulvivirga sediminis]MBL3657824.1 SDR family oxidoreductase [Fulvivirga sediminis]
MNRTISIIGCGWLGLPLSKELAKIGHQVHGSTTQEMKIPLIEGANVKPYLLDINHKGIKNNVFFDSEIIIITLPPSSDNYEENISRLIEAIEYNTISKVIFISSSSVYPNTNKRVKESDAKRIISKHSGVALLDIENQFIKNKNFESSILRFAGLYGPDRHPGRFLKRKSQLAGGMNPVNLIHLDDCLAIIKTIIEKDAWGYIFNACADEHPTRKEFYTAASQSLGLPKPEFTKEDTDFKIVDSSYLKTTLSYQFLHPDPMVDLEAE